MNATALEDFDRRDFLIKGTSALTFVGMASTAVPFISSWQPSSVTRLSGEPLSVNLKTIEEGAGIKFLWRGIPIWVVRRSQSVIDGLTTNQHLLKDPDSLESEQPEYARNPLRSRRADVIVLSGICTHLGCIPEFKPPGDADLGIDLAGGFFCACHGSRYDAAGRVIKGSPAPRNLPVINYYFADETTLVIGADSSIQGEA